MVDNLQNDCRKYFILVLSSCKNLYAIIVVKLALGTSAQRELLRVLRLLVPNGPGKPD